MAKRNESIADSFSERSNKAENETMKKILDWFSRLFKWEILNQTKKTKEELNNLSTGLIDEQLNLADKEISDNSSIESKITSKWWRFCFTRKRIYFIKTKNCSR